MRRRVLSIRCLLFNAAHFSSTHTHRSVCIAWCGVIFAKREQEELRFVFLIHLSINLRVVWCGLCVWFVWFVWFVCLCGLCGLGDVCG